MIDHTKDVYALAVRRQRLRASGIAGELDVEPSEAAEAVVALVEAGLLAREVDDADLLYPVVPQAVQARLFSDVSAKIERCQREYDAIRTRLADFVAVHDATMGELDRGQQVRTLMGMDTINEEIIRASRRCTTEVLTAQPGGARRPEALAAAWRDTEAFLRRGVRMRTVYQQSACSSAATMNYAEKATAAGAEIRTVVGAFERLIVFDRETAFVPARADRRAAALIREPSVVAHLAATFDHMWEIGRPLIADRPAPADQDKNTARLRAAIVRLLAEGLTDEGVADRVGLSVRACRNHIAKLYEQYGARSRFQLGMRLTSTGAIDSASSLMLGTEGAS